MPDGRDVSSLPFGPWTITVLPSIFTVTPFGIAIGFFPIRDISALSLQPSAISYISAVYRWLRTDARQRFSLPNLAQQFAAESLTTRLAPCHHTFRRGQDIDSETSEHPRNLGPTYIHAAARARHPRQVCDHRLVVVAVLQVDPQDLVALFFRRLEVRDKTLFLQDAGYLILQL